MIDRAMADRRSEVSPSTFLRYFPTKADVVLYDVLDPPLLEALRAQPTELSPIQALRGAMRAVLRCADGRRLGAPGGRPAAVRVRRGDT